MKHFRLYLVFFISLILGLFFNSTTIWASKSGLVTELNSYAQTNENADFKKVEVKGNTLTVYIADDYVETVNDYGLESYLEDTYKQVNKYQKKNNTKLSIVFKDKASGTFAKSSYSGKGWFKSTDTTGEKYNFNFKTGEVD
ncbi:MAG: hypothetical protein Q4E15_09655 [Lactobacillus johnsonii]|nr:hypothetical protein [Lactobacillus johnsonii]